jgi:REP element-mobilizing transposase RayT
MTAGIYTNTGYYNRRSIRLRGYDYSRPGAYFITICVNDHAKLVFGRISVGATGASPFFCDGNATSAIGDTSPRIVLNEFGEIVRDEWERSFKIRAELIMDEYIIMPDHLHAIIHIRNTGYTPVMQGGTPVDMGDALVAPTRGAKPRSIEAVIAGFKSVTIKRINGLRKTRGAPVWQRNYFDHIIRDEKSQYRIRQYIRNNPAKWFADKENHLQNEIKELYPG